MFSWLVGKRDASQGAVQLNLERIGFLMEFLQKHVFKEVSEVVSMLNQGLLLDIPNDIRDPEGRVWLDPSNKNLAISFNCNDASHPKRIDQFVITGFEELANTLLIGTAHESMGRKLMWSVSVESSARGVPPMARAVQEDIWKMPGYKLNNFGNFQYLQKV